MRERNTETSPRQATHLQRPRQPGATRAVFRALCVLLPVCWCGIAQGQEQAAHEASEAEAEEAETGESADDALAAPTPRMLGMISGGGSLRLTVDSRLGQERLGPVYGSVLLGYVLPGSRLQHGFGVGTSWNATHDGGYTTPVYALEQIAVMPAYVGYYQLGADAFSIGHIGLPILVRGGPSAGLELGAALAYRVFAGTGVFAGVNLNSHLARGFNLFASLELGLVIDYEVLP
jgi:hypothetical protein